MSIPITSYEKEIQKTNFSFVKGTLLTVDSLMLCEITPIPEAHIKEIVFIYISIPELYAAVAKPSKFINIASKMIAPAI